MTRRHITAPIVAIAALAMTVIGPTAPAGAAVPDVALRWAYLMKRSLNVAPQTAVYRKQLATQQVAVKARAAEMATAQTADNAARARLATATTADRAARSRVAAAQKARLAAKQELGRAEKLKPRNQAAVNRARTALAAANGAVNLRTKEAQRVAANLAAHTAAANAAAATLRTATGAWNAAGAAVADTQQKIVALGNAAGLAAMASKISKDVVTQVRPGFTVADTTQVYGVTVHKAVAVPFKRMVDDAKAAGIAISAGGFRTKERQIELRKINGCPDIWTAPASSCRVPTAIPGRSLHELGLAVDITSGGKTINSKTPAFAWLSTHAAAYGFVNLPSEAWHWSITGG
ncbi:M15 family metallopeptidase [Actinoplanes sp. CA-030573]|uniref:M15 family metallopeptidase n=1 Tax=Actinoplanes sp. CA-030573 TaxID=3239898 RepID=UPI003D8DB40D